MAIESELEGISTPDRVETSIGELRFRDGAPLPETAELAYDYLDRARGVEVFLNAMPGASVHALVKGPEALGVSRVGQVLLFDGLMDSASLFLTGNTSTLYACPVIDLRADGPTVVEVPPGMLGAFNDMWFRYVGDLGPAGPDKGAGGNYLLLPPGYTGDVPEGYFVLRPRTFGVWTFMRGSVASGLEAGVANIVDNLKVYPLARRDNPPEMEFISGSGKSFNTIHPNTYEFYEHVNELVQEESDEMLDVETRGLLASIGIVKGEPFEPDDRMKRILTDAVAIGNAIARSIVWYPRMPGARIYPDTDSAWMMGWVDKDVFFEKDGARNLDARVMFHYPYTAVTPAMAVSVPGKGSDYGIAYLDAAKEPFDGAATYRLHLPPDPPVNDFWALTLYDSQTRSQLQTSQRFPTVGSNDPGLEANPDGSYDIYFGPEAPTGREHNWLETVPGKSWFVALRMYGPEQAWIDKTWRPGEIERLT
jgi:hypothetical protein